MSRQPTVNGEGREGLAGLVGKELPRRPSPRRPSRGLLHWPSGSRLSAPASLQMHILFPGVRPGSAGHTWSPCPFPNLSSS